MTGLSKLAEYRAKWEQGGQAICTTVKQYTDKYKTVFAIIKYPDSYALHRYFTLGAEWVVSGSGFKKEGIKGIFLMVQDVKKERPKGYGICCGSCAVCGRCLIGRKTVIQKH